MLGSERHPVQGAADTGGVLGSTNVNVIDVNSKGFVNGWAQLEFIYSNALLIGGSTTVVNLLDGVSTTFAGAATYVGLPVVGFAVQSYNNNVIVVSGKNVQSTYGADFAHRFDTRVTHGAGAVIQHSRNAEGRNASSALFFGSRGTNAHDATVEVSGLRRLSESSCRL